VPWSPMRGCPLVCPGLEGLALRGPLRAWACLGVPGVWTWAGSAACVELRAFGGVRVRRVPWGAGLCPDPWRDTSHLGSERARHLGEGSGAGLGCPSADLHKRLKGWWGLGILVTVWSRFP
jgi:hypothetical protein